MSRKTATIAAIAAVAFATTLFPSGQTAAALAQAANDPRDVTAEADTAELVPETPEYIAQEVVQPLPAQTPEPTLTQAGSLSELVGMMDPQTAISAELHCLAGAVYFEARGEPLAGQLAVAQVIINRTEDGRFPRTYCSVVAQPGQFSFMRGSAMPAVRTGSAAWTRAVAVAQIAHQGLWQSEAGEAVFFHARYVQPQWSQRKTRLAQIDTHIFYR